MSPIATLTLTPSMTPHHRGQGAHANCEDEEDRHDGSQASKQIDLKLPVWSMVLSLFTGVSQVRRMVRKEDWTKIMFVYLCLFHVTPGQLCGPSPLSPIESIANDLGKELSEVLSVIRVRSPAYYAQLETHWRQYLECVSLVDTGYF